MEDGHDGGEPVGGIGCAGDGGFGREPHREDDNVQEDAHHVEDHCQED